MNEILKIMQVSNSCVNVFIYAGMNSHFRKAVIQFVQGRQVASTFSGVSQRFSTVEKHRRMTIACDDRRNTDSSNTSSNSTILRVELIPSRRASDIWRRYLLMLMKESSDKQWYIGKGIFSPSQRRRVINPRLATPLHFTSYSTRKRGSTFSNEKAFSL